MNRKEPYVPAWLLTLIQAVFALIVCAGVYLIYPPAALILGGAVGVFACERAA
jgi:hypothetical protein